MKYKLTRYKYGGKSVYLWQYEDKDGSTKTLTLEEFIKLLREAM